MAERVFLHIGLPKTGTTYLQGILWHSQERLRAEGILLPGSGHREHLWAALDVQERKGLAKRHPRAPGAWSRLVAEVGRHRGTAIITHEFLCGATRQQAATAVAALAPAEVHLIITARDALGMLTAGWQESVKNGGTATMAKVAARRGAGAGSEFSWRTWDLGGVLRRWAEHVPAEHVHILPMPDRKVSAPDQHWRNFGEVIGVDPGAYEAPPRAANAAIGYTQVEVLRLVNQHLGHVDTSVARGEWIRGYLAENLLARQEVDPIVAPPRLVAQAARRADRALALIAERGFDVRGDVSRLAVSIPQGDPPKRPTPRAVADAAAHLVADMLADVRALTDDNAVVARAAQDSRG